MANKDYYYWNHCTPVDRCKAWCAVGTYGSSVGSLFNFARWLFFVNVILFVVWLTFVLLPQSVYFDYSTVNKTFSVLDFIDTMVAYTHAFIH